MNEDQTACPLCDGYGHIITENSVHLCRCILNKRQEQRLQRANIPHRYRSKTLANYKADIDSRRRVLTRVQRFIEEFNTEEERPGLFLYGASGTGKTHLAIGALRELLQKGHTGLFYNMVQLIQDLRSQATSDASPDESKRLERLQDVDVLVLDDLGVGKLSDFVKEQVYSVIDQRWANNKCLIVTSNLPMNELEQQITYPVFSRVRGMCYTIETGDLDFRNPDLTLHIPRKTAKRPTPGDSSK